MERTILPNKSEWAKKLRVIQGACDIEKGQAIEESGISHYMYRQIRKGLASYENLQEYENYLLKKYNEL
jgi:hypothetical protein